MKNILIDRMNAEQELKAKIALEFLPCHPELADLKAELILKMASDFYQKQVNVYQFSKQELEYMENEKDLNEPPYDPY